MLIFQDAFCFYFFDPGSALQHKQSPKSVPENSRLALVPAHLWNSRIRLNIYRKSTQSACIVRPNPSIRLTTSPNPTPTVLSEQSYREGKTFLKLAINCLVSQSVNRLQRWRERNFLENFAFVNSIQEHISPFRSQMRIRSKPKEDEKCVWYARFWW